MDKKAAEFLIRYGITMTIQVGSDICPSWGNSNTVSSRCPYGRCQDTHGRHYKVTLSHEKREPFTFDFWDSWANHEKNKLVTPFDILANLAGDVFGPTSVKEVNNVFGDVDRLLALKVADHNRKVRNFFCEEAEREELARIEDQ